VKLSSIAFFASVFIFSGVVKSGSPTPKFITSFPCFFISFAREETVRVGDGFIAFPL